MATYLVTGGGGFIGSNIVYELLDCGESVRVLDNFSTGRRINLTNALSDIHLIEGDLCDPEICRQAVVGVDYILHQAAIPSVQRSISNPITSHNVNTNGTLNLLNAAIEAGVKRLVFASSSSVYGDSPTMPKHEEMPLQPKSPYAVSKMAAEHYCRVFAALYDIEVVCLRYFNVFGPRQDPASQYSAVIPLFIKAMLAGKSPIIFGDGLQSRDFTYVSNNVAANILAASTPNINGQVFNIACGERYTLLDLIAELNNVLGTNIEPVLAKPRSGDVKHSLADIGQAKEKMDYTIKCDFRTGLSKTVEWYQKSEVYA